MSDSRRLFTGGMILYGAASVALIIAVGLATYGRWTREPAFAYVWLSRQVRAGHFGPHVYNDQAVTDELARLTHGRVHDIISPTPPSAGLVLLPLAFLSGRWLEIVWTAGNVTAAIAAVAMLSAALEWPVNTWVFVSCGVALFCLSAPLQENLFRGQLYLWMLFNFSLATFGYATGRDRLTGLGLALALLSKAAGLPVWLLLVVSRRWRILAWATLMTGVPVLFGLPWIGIDSYRRWAFEVVPNLADDAHADGAGIPDHRRIPESLSPLRSALEPGPAL